MTWPVNLVTPILILAILHGPLGRYSIVWLVAGAWFVTMELGRYLIARRFTQEGRK